MAKQRKNRIGELEDELKRRDERIAELRSERDDDASLINRLTDHLEDHKAYLENFVATFGLTLDDDGRYTNGDFINRHIELAEEVSKRVDKYNALVDRFNDLLRDYENVRGTQRPVGRPIAASDAQQDQVRKYHREGKSIRWIAESMTLSRRTVSTVLDKDVGNDRSTVKRRAMLGVPREKKPPRRKWSFSHLPRQTNALLDESRELITEAKGLGKK